LFKTFLWKEFKELKRDKKVLIGSVILPLIIFPILGVVVFASQLSTPVFSVVVLDPHAEPYAKMLESVIQREGGQVVTNNATAAQVLIIFPRGFATNVSNLSSPVTLRVETSVSANAKANQILDDALYNLTLTIAYQRISELAAKANVTVNPSLIWSPLKVERGYLTIQSKPAQVYSALLVDVARLVAFLLFPGSTPVVFYVVEGLIGERERRTLEALLSTPTKVSAIIYSKLLVSLLLGFLSSLGDLVGVSLLLLSLGLYSSVPLAQAVTLVAFIIGITIGNLLVASLLTLIFMYVLGGSSKSFQLISLVVTTFGLLASFYALAFSPSFLSFPETLSLLIPFVQFSASLMVYVAGNPLEGVTIFGASVLVTLLLMVLVASRFSSERLLLK
jgi:ABC-2 type transport system permease protein